MSTDPISSWEKLRRSGQTSSTIETPSLSSGTLADAGPVRFALGLRGEGRLLLPISGSEKMPKIPETPTLLIRDARFTLDGTSGRYIDLACLVPELEGVFAEVAGEIVKRIAAGHGAAEACRTTLGEFRLLLVPGTSQVSREEIIGLIGELILLNDLLDITPEAVQLWRGPRGERHDFRGGVLAIEVKTAARAGHEKMHVSSLDQLLEPADGELCVTRYTLEQSAGASLTVGALAAKARGKASNPLLIRDLLAELGCTDPDSGVWNVCSCELQEERSYRIEDPFPRIVPGSLIFGTLPAGVSDLEYCVDLAAAAVFRMSASDAAEFRARMCACL